MLNDAICDYSCGSKFLADDADAYLQTKKSSTTRDGFSAPSQTTLLPSTCPHLFFRNICDELKQERQTVVSEILVNDQTNRTSTLVVQPIFDQVDGQEIVAYFKLQVPWLGPLF
jgi:hypothetical protein